MSSTEGIPKRSRSRRTVGFPPFAPLIYYVHPLLVGEMGAWDAVFDHAVDLAFDTVLIAPPFAPGRRGSMFLPFDWERLHPLLGHGGDADSGLSHLVDKARRRGLSLMMDLVADRLAADSRLAEEGLRFHPKAISDDILDPRLDPADQGGLSVLFDETDSSPHPHIGRLSERLKRLASAGIAGFRCLHVDRVPPFEWQRLMDAVRLGNPGTRFLAWTPGVSYDARDRLRGTGFDAVFSSLAWWDLRDTWIVDEHELHRSIGNNIAFPEAPFGKRFAQAVEPPALLERRAARALALAAAFGDGLLVPMGFEFGCRERFHPERGNRGVAGLRGSGSIDLSSRLRAANVLMAKDARSFSRKPIHLLVDGSSAITTVIKIDAEDARRAESARLVLVNGDLRRSADSTGAFLMSGAAARFVPFVDSADDAFALTPSVSVRLAPGEVRVFTGRPPPVIATPTPALTVESAVLAPRLVIENITPAVDDGLYPVKRIVGEVVEVEADIFGDGHDPLAAALLWRAVDEPEWRQSRMTFSINDRWTGAFPLERLGRYEFAIETWRDPFAIFRSELQTKHDAGLDLKLELEEGRLLVEAAAEEAAGDLAPRLRAIGDRLADSDDSTRCNILLAAETSAIMVAADRRPFRLRSKTMSVDAERKEAGFASWYELFPRSQSGDLQRHGTFDDVIGRLPAIRRMGFDVLYLTPIHPIGRTNRKGRNNTLTAGPEDPGSPYAIGSEEGGHDAIHPELGTFDDFGRLVAAAAENGLELALDIAVQASPDHPWLKAHPEWFDWRPDGTIKYAENPPKKYEDIVNVDFYTEGALPSLWVELRDVIMVWVKQGVKLFRIDNPHTKPFPFWEWLIADVRRNHPDVVFLAEAFTRPKVMYRLAKIGFSQSYTYFTWRNEAWELADYISELTQKAPKDFFRPHFFVNTPDINPDFLQDAPRSAYLIRAALATMLSGLWGMYNGFELCEGRPDTKKKEYADSEKYEIRAWDWNRVGNIIAEITALNRIRRENPALRTHLGITILNSGNENVLLFEKATPGRENVVIVAVSLDPYSIQEANLEIPLWAFGVPDNGSLTVEDLMRGHRFIWTGKMQRIHLDPAEIPFSIWRLAAKEQ